MCARALALVGVASLLAVMPAGPAAADDEPLTGICAFPISHEFPSVHARGHELPGQAPYDFVDTGQFKVIVTNLDTGESAQANANAAAFWVDEHTLILRGQVVWFRELPVGHIPAGVSVVNGVTRVTLNDEGRAIAAEGGVVRRDICAEISSA